MYKNIAAGAAWLTQPLAIGFGLRQARKEDPNDEHATRRKKSK